jgi:hypothetical protein
MPITSSPQISYRISPTEVSLFNRTIQKIETYRHTAYYKKVTRERGYTFFHVTYNQK